ncbi:ABC transporter ATP-binding protein [Geomicrobium sediminis]|uniref:Putative hemin import ATP-binding protein HrtA n=1 Tax=Geomicrobium sediminis TaxID=1347788 RepID=A0ABS2P9P1_9BACL|nr:ABC transporter ATP-binding protein [Geomicrobium sediminis]MBM7632100.1 putative ABC transport system ATP-binding protein [Geomicrobium sediminis]
MNAKLSLQHVQKTFTDGDRTLTVLKDVSFDIFPGEFVAIVGPSGSGKSTMLSIAGALLSPSSGKLLLDGKNIADASEKERQLIRLHQIGFIFQSSHLLPYLTVKDQLMLMTRLSKESKKDAEQRAERLLTELGLRHRLHQYPERLSGGERQRVAIARAWMNEPDLILADEPTASLDTERGQHVIEQLAQQVKQQKRAAIMVTHDERMLAYCDRVITLEDGAVS